ncbi:uncharacterized protein LOC144911092 [Branchiostoma floridae x Branchiostoma belcheri]
MSCIIILYILVSEQSVVCVAVQSSCVGIIGVSDCRCRRVLQMDSDLLEDCKNLDTSELPPLVLIDGEVLSLDLSMKQHSDMQPLTSLEHVEAPSTSVKEEPEELQQCDQEEKRDAVVPNFEMLNKSPDSGVQRQVSEEDEEKARMRREKNRKAAARCRHKVKEKEETLRKKTLHLENSNSGLRAEIGRLKLELRNLRSQVVEHMELCHSGDFSPQEWKDLSEET